METYRSYYQMHHVGQFTSNDIKFCDWINNVGNIVLNTVGFHLLELEDEMYMENFENGMTSNEMACIVINHFEKFRDYLGL